MRIRYCCGAASVACGAAGVACGARYGTRRLPVLPASSTPPAPMRDFSRFKIAYAK